MRVSQSSDSYQTLANSVTHSNLSKSSPKTEFSDYQDFGNDGGDTNSSYSIQAQEQHQLQQNLPTNSNSSTSTPGQFISASTMDSNTLQQQVIGNLLCLFLHIMIKTTCNKVTFIAYMKMVRSSAQILKRLLQVHKILDIRRSQV